MKTVITEPPERSNPYLDRVQLVLGDITKQDTDAVVSLLPQNLDYKGSLNEALLEASGEGLDEFVLEHIIRPRPADIYAVPGFKLPCKHIFFCVVPNWRTGFDRQDKFLLYAVRKALELARELSLSSLSIPVLGSGRSAFPKPRAARLIAQGVNDRMHEGIQNLRIVCEDEDTLELFKGRF